MRNLLVMNDSNMPIEARSPAEHRVEAAAGKYNPPTSVSRDHPKRRLAAVARKQAAMMVIGSQMPDELRFSGEGCFARHLVA